jgi:hypothetical protein
VALLFAPVGLYTPFFTQISVQMLDAVSACCSVTGTAQLLPSLKMVPAVVTRQTPAQAGALANNNRKAVQLQRCIVFCKSMFPPQRTVPAALELPLPETARNPATRPRCGALPDSLPFVV